MRIQMHRVTGVYKFLIMCPSVLGSCESLSRVVLPRQAEKSVKYSICAAARSHNDLGCFIHPCDLHLRCLSKGRAADRRRGWEGRVLQMDTTRILCTQWQSLKLNFSVDLHSLKCVLSSCHNYLLSFQLCLFDVFRWQVGSVPCQARDFEIQTCFFRPC